MVVDFLVLPASDGTVLPTSVLTEAFSTAGIEIAGELTAAPVTDVLAVTTADVASAVEAEAEPKAVAAPKPKPKPRAKAKPKAKAVVRPMRHARR